MLTHDVLGGEATAKAVAVARYRDHLATLAKEYGVEEEDILAWVEEKGRKPAAKSRAGRPPKPITAEMRYAADMADQGKALRDIAEALSVSYPTARNWVRRVAQEVC